MSEGLAQATRKRPLLPSELKSLQRARLANDVGKTQIVSSTQASRPFVLGLRQLADKQADRTDHAAQLARRPFASLLNRPLLKLSSPFNDGDDESGGDEQTSCMKACFSFPQLMPTTIEPSGREKETASLPDPDAQVPIDLALKTSVVFTSPTSFSRLVDEGRTTSSEVAALDRHLALPLSPASGFHALTHYWRWPARKLPAIQMQRITVITTATVAAPATTKSLKNSRKELEAKEEIEYYRVMMGEWREALRFLYARLVQSTTSFRQVGRESQQEDSSFYYLQSDLVVHFRSDSAGVAEALIPRASRHLRKVLWEEGIQYAILAEGPGGSRMVDDFAEDNADACDAGSDDEDEDEEEAYDEDEDGEGVHDKENNAALSTMPVANGLTLVKRKLDVRAFPLAIHRVPNVNGLVDFLVNQREARATALLPELYSIKPFIHGTLARGEIRTSGPISGISSREPASAGDCRMYQLRVDGITMPSALRQMIALLNEPSGDAAVRWTATSLEATRDLSIFQ